MLQVKYAKSGEDRHSRTYIPFSGWQGLWHHRMASLKPASSSYGQRQPPAQIHILVQIQDGGGLAFSKPRLQSQTSILLLLVLIAGSDEGAHVVVFVTFEIGFGGAGTAVLDLDF